MTIVRMMLHFRAAFLSKPLIQKKHQKNQSIGYYINIWQPVTILKDYMSTRLSNLGHYQYTSS